MYTIYQIQAGDSLESVASRLGILPDELKKLNGLADSTLRPGGFLIVPSNTDQPSNKGDQTYLVKKGDNMYQIAREYQVDYPFLLVYNGLTEKDYIYPGEEIKIPSKNARVYFTEEGDTLADVSQNLGLSVSDLMAKNPDLFLAKGQIIRY